MKKILSCVVIIMLSLTLLVGTVCAAHEADPGEPGSIQPTATI